MDVVEGFCLKCKTYGPIKDGQLIKMKNGRTRMGGLLFTDWMYWQDFQDRELNSPAYTDVV